MLNPERYTVGWITASRAEYDAARYMLDELHNEPLDEHAHYQLGRVGSHNVVVATMPQGQADRLTVADVARNLIHTFPDLRVGLLVGIGSGVPCEGNDIRLGDVVVGRLAFQCDLSKTLRDRHLRGPGPSNIPPPSLMSAMTHRGFYKQEGRHINEIIDSVFEGQRHVRSRYKRPDRSTDRLFRANIFHVEHGAKCEVECADNPQNLIDRPGRNNPDDNPTVHQGLVASIDQSIEDARLRDRVGAKNGVLCFDTEAAGLMSYFPCAVIRGISDYSDSHKNAQWQRYAIMTATAYAKRLLHYLDPLQLKDEKKISDVFFENEDISNWRGLKLERVGRPGRFFRLGRVFAMVWIEPYTDRQGGQKNDLSSLKDQAFSEVRRFIVIHRSHNASLCVPIHTYGGQGVHKRNIKIEDHARIYRSEDEPPPNRENIPLRDPIPITLEGSEEMKKLHSESLVNFGKIYTVEHGARVMNVGFIQKSHSQKLELNWKTSIVNESSTIGTESTEAKHTPNVIQEESHQEIRAKKQQAERMMKSPPSDRSTMLLGLEMARGQPEKSDVVESKLPGIDEEILSLHENSTENHDQTITDRQAMIPWPNLDLQHGEHNDFSQKSPSRDHQSPVETDSEMFLGANEETNLLSDGSKAVAALNSQKKTTEGPLKSHTDSERKYDEEGHREREQHRGNTSRRWACPFFRLDLSRYTKCGNDTLTRFYDVIQHLEKHHTLPEDSYYCPKCWSKFTLAVECKKHVSKCQNNAPREHFYYNELRRLKRQLRCPKQKLRSKLQGSFSDSVSKYELRWHYIWQKHFSNETPTSLYINDLVSEIANFLFQENNKSLHQVLRNGIPDPATVLRVAYNPTVAPRYWFHHSPEPDPSLPGHIDTQTCKVKQVSTMDITSERLDAIDKTLCQSTESVSADHQDNIMSPGTTLPSKQHTHHDANHTAIDDASHEDETSQYESADDPREGCSSDPEANTSSDQPSSSECNKATVFELDKIKSDIVRCLYSENKIEEWKNSSIAGEPTKIPRKRARAPYQYNQAYILKGHDVCDDEEIPEDFVNLSNVSFLACPFYAFDSKKYNMCLLKHDIRSINDLTSHLIQDHPIPHSCPICGQIFSKAVQRDEHARLGKCEQRDFGKAEGVDADRKAKLEALCKLALDDAMLWKRAYRIVLPGRNPYSHPTHHLTGAKELSISLVRYHWGNDGQAYIAKNLSKNPSRTIHGNDGASTRLHRLILKELLQNLETEYHGKAQENSADQMEQG